MAIDTRLALRNGTAAKSTSASDYIRGTVTRAEEAASQAQRRRNETQSLMALDSGFIYVAARRNAAAVCSFAPRLYKASGSRSSKTIDAKRLRALRDPAIVGRKAAMYAMRAENVEEVASHPSLDLLDNPNPQWAGSETWMLDATFLELAGNSYLNVVTDRKGVPMELWPMFPQAVVVIADRRGIIAGYAYGRDMGDMQRFKPEDVIHQRFPSPHSPYYGMSWIAAVLAQARNFNAIDEEHASQIENNVKPEYVVTVSAPMGRGGVEAIEAQLQQKFGGARKRGKPLILAGKELAITPLTWSPKDMLLIDQQKWDRDVIAAASGVPVSKLTVEDVNRANAAEGSYAYLADTIRPRLILRADALTYGLLPHYGYEDGAYWFAYDNPVPEDQQRTATISSTLVNAGIITPNEARADHGLEPIEDASADTLRAPVQPGVYLGGSGYEGDDATDAAPPAVPSAPFDPQRAATTLDVLGRVAGGTLAPDAAAEFLVGMVGMDPEKAAAMVAAQATRREEIADESADQAADGGGQEADGDASAGKPTDDDRGDDDDPARKGLDGGGAGVGGTAARDRADAGLPGRVAGKQGPPSSDEYARGTPVDEPPEESELPAVFRDYTSRKFIRDLERYFTRQRDAVMEAVAQNPHTGKAFAEAKTIEDAASAFLLRSDLWDAQLARIVAPHVRKAAEQGGKKGQEAIAQQRPDSPAAGVALDVNNPRIREVMERETRRFVQSVNAETERRIREVLIAQPPEATADQVAASVRDAFATLTPGRSEMIARTETARFVETGQVEQWRETGVVSKKRWLLSPGACEICRAIAGQDADRPLDLPFFTLGSSVTLPGGGVHTFDFSDVDGPPAHPSCFLPDTPVLARHPVAAFLARYRGKAVELSMADGRRLAVTANHQLLTPSGFVAAESIRKGDDVIRCVRPNGPVSADPDDDYRPSKIQDVVGAFAVSRGVSAARVPSASEYLHGDGRFCDGDIHVVRSDRLLRYDAESTLSKKRDHPALCWGYDAATLAALGDLDAMLVAMSFAAQGGMGMRGPLLSLLGGRVAHAGVHALAAVAGGQAIEDHPSVEDAASDAFTIRDALETFPGLVTLDQVVDVRYFDFDGHVYDLQTESGLTIGNDIITSNCRCSLVPVLEGEPS